MPKRALPMLESVKIASPCSADWNEMIGDDRVRFCASCEKHVYNLSAMRASDAEQLLRERADGELCVRFYQRADGTVMTSDCPVGVRRQRRKKVALAVAGAGAMAYGALASLRTATVMGAPPPRMGEIAMVDTPPSRLDDGTNPPVMGGIAPAPDPAIMGTTTAPPPPPPPPRAIMGAPPPAHPETQPPTKTMGKPMIMGRRAAPQPAVMGDVGPAPGRGR